MILFFSVLCFFYGVFLLWLRNGLKSVHGLVDDEHLEEPPSVSVVVAARNEEENIESLLDHLVEQNYPSDLLDITIADDNSSDGTGEIVESYSQRDSRVRHLAIDDTPGDWSPKMWALSKAVKTSGGEILLFTDADCTMGPDWVVSMVSPFRKEDVGFVSGPSPLEKNGGIWERMLLLDSIGQDALAAGGLARGVPLTACGRNLAIKRSAFEEVKGYEDIRLSLSGDDDLMMHKIAFHDWQLLFLIESEAEVTSAPPSTLPEFIRQRLRFASKGKIYYNLPFIRGAFRWILLLIYLTNLTVLIGQIMFVVTLNSVWLLPWFLKMLGDGLLIGKYTSILARPYYLGVFFLNEIWHSFYVVVIGILGSFVPIAWKGRKKTPGMT